MSEPPLLPRPGSPVRGLRFTNFRSFRDTGYLSVRPINFIFGKNSSGKTTILRSFLLFKQLVAETTLSGEVPFVGPYADFGSYEETVYNGEKSRDITLSITIPLSAQTRGRFRNLSQTLSSVRRLDVSAVLHWNRLGHAQFNSIEFADATPGVERRVLLCLTRTAPNKSKIAMPEFGLSTTIEGESDLSFSSLSWMGFYPSRTETSDARDAYQQLEMMSFELFRELRQAVQKIEHIGPLRDMPERAYRLAEVAIPAGSTQHVLGLLEKNSSAIRVVSTALNELRVARQIQLARPAPGWAGIVVKDVRTGRNANLADVGFGVSQVLPIIARVATARAGSLILIEQPELHLHPDTQGRLVDVLLDLASRRRVSLFIESHSEAILLRLRRRVAEGVIDSSDIRIYVTDNGEVRTAEMKEDGMLDMAAFPPDFFEEDWFDAVAIARAAAPGQ